MTMLDRMRRHKTWLKWSLAVVCATFVLLYVPQFLDPTGTGGAAVARGTVATVEGRKIDSVTYQQVYFQQLSQLQQAYGGQFTEEMARQLGFGQRVIQQLVGQEAQVVEAERLGLTVTDGELRERLIRLPAFQQNGQFVGDQMYRQILASARPPMRPAEFEEDLRRSLLAEKLQDTVTGWLRVSDAEVEEAYRRQHERVKLELAVFDASALASSITPTEAEITAEYETNPDAYRVEEKRRVRYLALDAASLRSTVSVTPEEVEARYRANVASFSTPEQTRASHILFSTQDGADPDEARKEAEGVLARVLAGEDFAALAREYSDDLSAAAGGDLGFNARGAMVPPFDEVVWSLEPGQTHDQLVETQFGFHIIRVEERQPAVTRTLEEVRADLENQIRTEKAAAEATRLSQELASQIKAPADLERIANERGLTLGDSGLFGRSEPLSGLGFAPAVAAQTFQMSEGDVSGALATMQGYAFITLAEVREAHLPPLDDVRTQVRDAVARRKAIDEARSRAATLAANRGNFAAAARSAGAAVRTTDFVARGAALPDIGVSDQVDRAAFAVQPGERTEPIVVGSNVVVAQVVERQDIVPEGLASQREALRAQLTNDRRSEFFNAYMTRAMRNMNITYNEETIATLLGG
jgi:peptidyl-prolyl cis-trans isomerase D